MWRQRMRLFKWELWCSFILCPTPYNPVSRAFYWLIASKSAVEKAIAELDSTPILKSLSDG